MSRTPSEKTSVPLLGRLAVHHQMISMDQLAEVTSAQGRGDQRNIGEILVDAGYITPRQLEALLRAQKQVVAKQRAQRAVIRAAPVPEATPEKPVATPSEAEATSAKIASPPKSEAKSPEKLADSRDRAALDELLRNAVAEGASDVHLHARAPVRYRIDGELKKIGSEPLDCETVERMLLSILDARQAAEFSERGEIDFCYALEGSGRFRTNVYRQQRGTDGVFHCIPLEPPTLEDLDLPSELARFTNYHQGMVLVTGPAGCGKSSTLAALVRLINEERKEHIITVEDPIEFVHESKRCLVNQRSVRHHTESFARALRAALREDPDVIVIGELRDLETISLALTAAETGHFVLATLHTDNAIRTINRIVGAYPSNQQSQVRTMLSESLRAVISQKLIRRADGPGRVAAIETLVVNRAVGNLIRENKTFQIHSILQTGSAQGMQLFDHAIAQLAKDGVISQEDAIRQSSPKKSQGD